MSYFYNRPKGFWWWFSRFRTTGVGNSARWDVTYLSLAAVFRRILTTGPLSLELSLCTAQRSPLAPERQPLQKPPAPSQGRLSSSLMWARSKEKWGSRFAVRTLPKGVEGERREPCGCEPLNKGSFSWELKCRVLVPVFSPPGKFLNIPALSYSKEATRGYVSRGEGSGAGAQGRVGRHRRDRKPGTEEGCAYRQCRGWYGGRWGGIPRDLKDVLVYLFKGKQVRDSVKSSFPGQMHWLWSLTL